MILKCTNTHETSPYLYQRNSQSIDTKARVMARNGVELVQVSTQSTKVSLRVCKLVCKREVLQQYQECVLCGGDTWAVPQFLAMFPEKLQ